MSQPGLDKPKPQPERPMIKRIKFWEYAEIGYDTEKKAWFVQFFNDAGQSSAFHIVRNIFIESGNAIQYQWKDAEGRPLWHIRERFFPDEIEDIDIDVKTHDMTIRFKEDPDIVQETVKEEFAYLLYAYHLANIEGRSENRAPMGFLELYDSNGARIRRFNNRWIVVEGARRRTVGEFPAIRIRIDRKDVGKIIVTNTVLIVQGHGKRNTHS